MVQSIQVPALDLDGTTTVPAPEKFQRRLSHAKALFGPGKLFYVCLVCIPNQEFNISLKVRNVIEPKQD